MPLFSRTPATTAPPVVEETPKRRSTLFGRRRSNSPVTTTRHTTHGDRHVATSSTSPHNSRSLLHRHGEDPSIHGARDRVRNAELAEREADKALIAAKTAVREAREHVKHLEREAAEEARLAKIKQSQAKSLSKSAKHLGRHDHI